MKKISKLSFQFALIFIIVFSFSLNLYSGDENNLFTDVVAEKVMVASAHPVASSVGVEILKKGGNAVDAAIAMAFALSIAEPNASGIGGGGFLLVKMADADETIMVDYREMSPKKATPEFYYKTKESFRELTRMGATAVGVPGLVACADVILKKCGTMKLDQVLQPSIRLAREGIKVSDKLNGMITDNYEKIMTFPATAEIYLSEMMPLEAGAFLKNEDLAQTFEKIGIAGPEIFYEGELAKAIVDEVKNQKGIFELEDLKAYRAKFRKPVKGIYRGFEIVSAAPVTGGGTHLIELLNIMEGFDVKKVGHNSARFIHLFTEAMKMIYADKSLNAADPEFYTIPVDTFISKKYAARLRAKIDPAKAKFDYAPPKLIPVESSSTSHLSVVDKDGNIVALTQSINHWFGSGVVVPGTGILLNDHLSDFDSRPGRPNSIAPHKRPTSSIAPTLVLKDGKPFMTLGTPGGTRIISALAQIIMNVIDFDMSMDEAIEAPRFHCITRTLYVEGRIDKNVVEKLEALGHKVKVRADYDNYFGGAQGIKIDFKTKKLQGGADSRRDGVAVGY